jgi:hypothetical protein
MKTAVEWLFEQFVKKSCITLKDIQIAKEMEKQRIKDAYDAGLFDGSMDDVNDRIYKQYYKETFKSE